MAGEDAAPEAEEGSPAARPARRSSRRSSPRALPPSPPPPAHLLVLDLNGLLVERLRSRKEGGQPKRPPDLREGGCEVFFRAHMREFVRWCFEHFVVGVWTSAKAKNVRGLLRAVFGAEAARVAFVWDQARCTTAAQLRHPENRAKPIFLKELEVLWASGAAGPPGLYAAHNSVLLDDSIYKSALNPAHTAVHPAEWRTCRAGARGEDAADDGLAPGGALRTLLGLLARAPDVRVPLEHAAAAGTYPGLVPSAAERAVALAAIPGLGAYCAARVARAARGARAGVRGAGVDGGTDEAEGEPDRAARADASPRAPQRTPNARAHGGQTARAHGARHAPPEPEPQQQEQGGRKPGRRKPRRQAQPALDAAEGSPREPAHARARDGARQRQQRASPRDHRHRRAGPGAAAGAAAARATAARGGEDDLRGSGAFDARDDPVLAALCATGWREL